MVVDVELIEFICARVMDGEHITHILREEGMPSTLTFYNWLNHEPELKRMYQEAMEIKVHHLAEEAMIIADKAGAKDNMRKVELQQKARWFLAEKLNRKMYGDHRNVNVQVDGEIRHSIHELLTDGTENIPVIDVVSEEDKPKVKELENASEESSSEGGEEGGSADSVGEGASKQQD